MQRPQVMKGYLNKPEETQNALRVNEGKIWMHTAHFRRQGKQEIPSRMTVIDSSALILLIEPDAEAIVDFTNVQSHTKRR